MKIIIGHLSIAVVEILLSFMIILLSVFILAYDSTIYGFGFSVFLFLIAAITLYFAFNHIHKLRKK